MPPTYDAPTWGGPEALITGELRYSEGCVSLLAEDGTETFLVFTSVGAPVVSGTTLTYDGAQYELGSKASFGGGYGIPANVSVVCGGADAANWFTVSSPGTTENE